MNKQIAGKIIIFFIVLGMVMSLSIPGAAAKDKQVLDQGQLNKAIQLQIEKNMPWPVGSMRFEVYTRLPELTIPAGNISWQVDIKNNYTYLGDSYFVLKLSNNGVVFREEAIRVKIEILRDFVVSNKNLNRDAIIGEQDVDLQKKWVRSIPVNSISNPAEVVGKSLGTGIRPNTEISRNMVKEVTAVKRGKMVQIVLESGAINITTMGLSEEDGTEGSMVRVKNVTSNKIFYARVIGDSRVRVDFQ